MKATDTTTRRLQDSLAALGGDYELRRPIGNGAMGVVYLAHDRERDRPVAIKTLHRVDPEAARRLKAEFRTISDIRHPNLVELHALLGDGQGWFLVMEHVVGRSLSNLLRGGEGTEDTLDLGDLHKAVFGPASTQSIGWDDTVPLDLLTNSESMPPAPTAQPALAPEQIPHLFRQLARAINALHDQGKLHCDIKPSNTMVGEDERVVLLDFGLAVDRLERGEAGTGRAIAGTPAYIAPEQLMHLPASPASDWYAFGSMLFEALAGRLPFNGTARAMMEAKVRSRAPTLEHAPGLPTELIELANRLLHRDPAQRPSGDEVLRVLEVGETTPTPDRVFLGRDDALAALEAARETAATGQCVVARIHGPGGTGKTALVQQLLERLQGQRRTLVFRGRCLARETVPYKAFDGVIDQLSDHLISPGARTRELMSGLQDLVALFPVLGRARRLRSDGTADPQERRARAFGQLRTLLRRIADTRQVVIFVDDVHWADDDSALLLRELLTADEPPPILLIVAYRSDQAVGTAFGEQLDRIARSGVPGLQTRDIELGAIEHEAAVRIASNLLEPEHQERAAEIAAEAAGTPLFIESLAHHINDGGTVCSLDELLERRLGGLDSGWRRALEIVSLAEGPLPRAVAARASGDPEFSDRLDGLLRARFARTFGGRNRVETYHHRLRRVVVDGLSDERREALHVALAGAWAANDHPPRRRPGPPLVRGRALGQGLRAGAASRPSRPVRPRVRRRCRPLRPRPPLPPWRCHAPRVPGRHAGPRGALRSGRAPVLAARRLGRRARATTPAAA